MMNRYWIFSLVFAIALLTSCSDVQTQTYIDAENTLTPLQADKTGAPVANGTVTVTHDKNATRESLKETAFTEATKTAAVLSTVRNALGTTSASTPSPRPSLTPSSTQFPTAVLHPSITPTATPTFNVGNVTQSTQSSPAQCPTIDSSLEYELPEDFTLYIDYPIEQSLLEFLNLGGAPESVNNGLKGESHFLDLTNDRVSDLIVNLGSTLIVGCENGKYIALINVPMDYEQNEIVAIQDMNLNHVPEIVITKQGCNGPCYSTKIYEWSGREFRSLISIKDPFQGNWILDETYMYGKVSDIRDVDFNGTLELVLTASIDSPLVNPPDWKPQRAIKTILTWNGANFVFYKNEYPPPEYRFQVVQDGDRESLAGNFDNALKFYQDAIFNEQLEWWSPERKQFIIDTWRPSNTPTPIPPNPDPAEYYNLAAYSRYRIMLLHILRGWHKEANIVYATLLEKFPVGHPGYSYTELATVFWDSYQMSQDIGLACKETVDFASANPHEILPYPGGDFKNEWYQYKPEDICPFR